MAKSPDNKAPQMLFTEFDLSDKGRPVPVVSGVPAESIRPLPSMLEVAATLDFDFEDDFDSPSSPESENEPSGSQRGDTQSENEQESNSNPAASEQDSRHSTSPSTQSDRGQLPARHLSPIEPPTWEEYTNGIKGASSTYPGKFSSAPDLSTRPEINNQPVAIDAVAKPENPGDEEDGEFDILSTLDRTGGIDFSGNDDTSHELDEFGDIQGEGDPFAEFDDAQTNDWFEPPEDGAGDESGGSHPSRGQNPSHRRPPKINIIQSTPIVREQDMDRQTWREPERIGDWYEPPEDAFGGGEPSSQTPEAADERRNRSTRQHQRPFQESDLNFGATESTRSSGRHPSSRQSARLSSSDTAVRLFSDVDTQEAWREKIRSYANASEESLGQDRGEFDPDNIDLFSDLDVNSIWEEKSRQKLASGSGAEQSPIATESTVILDKSLLADWMGEDYPGEEVPDWLSAINKGDAPSLSSTDAVGDYERDLDPEQTKKNELLISDLEDFLGTDTLRSQDDGQSESELRFDGDDGNGDADSGAEESFDPTGSGSPDPTDSWDVESESGAEAVSQDSVSGRDLSGLDDWKANRERDPLEGIEPGSLNPIDWESPTGARAGQSASGGESLSGEDEGEDGESEQSGSGFSTDDFLNAIDFNDETINDGVSAPVIDDSHIDMPSRSARRGAIEELPPDMEDSEFSDPADASSLSEEGDEDDEEGEEGESGPPADEVAIDPMDVFDNMDDMDFSDDFDEDMRSMLEDDEEGDGLNIDVDGFTDPLLATAGVQAEGRLGLVKHYCLQGFYRVVPKRYLEKVEAMVAWHDNWWFYCDLVAAIIASASLAIIISYYLWYYE